MTIQRWGREQNGGDCDTAADSSTATDRTLGDRASRSQRRARLATPASLRRLSVSVKGQGVKTPGARRAGPKLLFLCETTAQTDNVERVN